MRTITVTHELAHDDLVALRRAEGPEESIQEIVERLTRAAVAQSVAKGSRGIETDSRVANGDLHVGRAEEAVLVWVEQSAVLGEGETPA